MSYRTFKFDKYSYLNYIVTYKFIVQYEKKLYRDIKIPYDPALAITTLYINNNL